MTDLIADALTGPWHAVLVDETGYVWTADELKPDDLERGFAIVIVRGSSSPSEPDEDGIQHLEGIEHPEDCAAEWSDFDDLDTLRRRWAQAQAMADGLNNAAKQVTR